MASKGVTVRPTPGRLVPVNGRSVYIEQSGRGDDWVVFEAGAGAGRTCWDPVVPLLTDAAQLITYDRAGRARSGRISEQPSVQSMAEDLVAMTNSVVPEGFVLVAHSMGGLVARRAAERLGPRLRGLLLIDPTPETAPTYDDWDAAAAKADRMLAWAQSLSHVRPLRGLFVGNLRRGYSRETRLTIRDEDVTPTGTAQTRKEMRAAADAIAQFRVDPPQPPQCPVVVLAAARPTKQKPRQIAFVASAQEHDRFYVESLPNGRFVSVDSAHLMQAEKPEVIAAEIRQLLRATESVS
jgi:pimeloyl-ACP methyl ester carboxylesterase